MSVLTIARAQGYAVLTLNRPAARNALSLELRQALAAAVAGLAPDPAVRVLVLTGAGSTFCAGLDLKEIGGSDEALRAALAGPSPVDALRAFPGPVIGAINGPAVTGGFELALACDVLLASEEARFADTHGRVGLLPVWGLSQRLSRAIGLSRAKELSLTGNYIDARTACDWGLVNRVLPAAQLLPRRLRAGPRHAVAGAGAVAGLPRSHRCRPRRRVRAVAAPRAGAGAGVQPVGGLRVHRSRRRQVLAHGRGEAEA